MHVSPIFTAELIKFLGLLKILWLLVFERNTIVNAKKTPVVIPNC